MAINKILTEFQDLLGIDLAHTVITDINVDFKKDTLVFKVIHFMEADDYNTDKSPIRRKEYTFLASALPVSIITGALSMKDTLEQELISTLPEYQGGTQVYDDGEPIV